jgi:hypothetical protein
MPASASSMSGRRDFTDRVAEAQQLVESSSLTPELASADRELLINTLRSRRQAIGGRGAAEQLMHGEPHPGNVLSMKTGLLFIDLETCCRGPVEFDLAHVAKRSASVTRTLMKNCSVTAGALFLPWSPRGAGIRATNSTTGNEQLVNSSRGSTVASARRRDAPTGWSVAYVAAPRGRSLLEPPPRCHPTHHRPPRRQHRNCQYRLT